MFTLASRGNRIGRNLPASRFDDDHPALVQGANSHPPQFIAFLQKSLDGLLPKDATITLPSSVIEGKVEQVAGDTTLVHSLIKVQGHHSLLDALVSRNNPAGKGLLRDTDYFVKLVAREKGGMDLLRMTAPAARHRAGAGLRT